MINGEIFIDHYNDTVKGMYLTVNKDKYSGKNNSVFLVKWIFGL